jgi:hypothetical protein
MGEQKVSRTIMCLGRPVKVRMSQKETESLQACKVSWANQKRAAALKARHTLQHAEERCFLQSGGAGFGHASLASSAESMGRGLSKRCSSGYAGTRSRRAR